jgi:hypothetical protein
MRVCYLHNKYKHGQADGVINCIKNYRKVLDNSRIDSKLLYFGKTKNIYTDYIIEKNINAYDILKYYDVIHLNFNCYKVSDVFIETLRKLASKIVLEFHDVKQINSKAKNKNGYDIYKILIDNGARGLFHSVEEKKYYMQMFPNLKGEVLDLIYFSSSPLIKNKNRIVVTSRLTFSKGHEFVKKYIDSKLCKFDIEYRRSSRKASSSAFVFFSKFDSIINSDSFKIHNPSESYLDFAYGDAKILFNFTWFGDGSGGRPEYTVMEAWDYQCIPFLDERWVNCEGSIFKHEYNCIAIKRNDIEQLDYYVNKIFNDEEYYKTLVKNGMITLRLIENNNNKIIEYYNKI